MFDMAVVESGIGRGSGATKTIEGFTEFNIQCFRVFGMNAINHRSPVFGATFSCSMDLSTTKCGSAICYKSGH